MKRITLVCLFLMAFTCLFGEEVLVTGPDGQLALRFYIHQGLPVYSVSYQGKAMLEESPLGLVTSAGDFSKEMRLVNTEESTINEAYSLDRIKRSKVNYVANKVVLTLENAEKKQIAITFQVSNHDIAFKYALFQYRETANAIIVKEATGFDFPQHTTTFLSPQASPMIGWMRTKPSYEETYVPDERLGTPSRYGEGYTFPSLFHVGSDGWVLLSETGVRSLYCGAHLSEGSADGLYTIAYPNPGENNGIGSANPAIALPGETPWRTITVGNTLQPIVETTVPFDVVSPLYEASRDYRYGRSTWSWIMWQDNSINYDDQVRYIDLAAAMGYEYVLIDGLWDKQIGYERMPDLFKYAQSKGVDVFLWYNSNGYWNDAPQGAKQKMNNAIARKKEMKWLKELGIKGLKVDFFGGDKQETMKLYEDILSDANDYGLMIIFHGCTLPRGWERMYPNYVGSEAVLASENLIFTQEANDKEAFHAALHPFIRNTVGSMEFGPVLLNKRHNRTNDGGTVRKTTDIFQLATAVLFQNAVQMFALAPNNLDDVPSFEIDFMKQIPTTWDETKFIDGYPGKYVILARRSGEKWYIAAINATDEQLSVKVELPMLAGETVLKYGDSKNRQSNVEELNIKKNGQLTLSVQPNGGLVLVKR
ncbi:glycoside hydrolase family 97 protein [Olivibacter sitiensis]|uniref:glycoside hydrolase family 97 protein n=1 Tax=Olivibacter sitiensis TaxID=376470 RepID=UPI0004841B45|nr:glycoside hydrolase family 97 protein [Olivibacter sitiensis]